MSSLRQWIFVIYDAFRNAQMINQGELGFAGKRIAFWIPAITLTGAIAVVIFLVVFSVVLTTEGFGVHLYGAVNDSAHSKNVTERHSNARYSAR